MAKKTVLTFNPIEVVYGQFLKREKAEQEERERSFAHHPSGLCALGADGKFIGKCRRALFYELTYEKRRDPIDADGLMKMHIGSLLHREMSIAVDEALPAEFATQAEEGVGDEIVVKWEEPGLTLPFSGRMDKRIRAGDNWFIGCEWKSVWGMGVNDIKNNGPKEDALLQVIAYLHQRVHPLDEYLLGYVARDSCYIYSFRFTVVRKKLQIEWLNSKAVTISPWSMDDIRRALAGVETVVASGEAPARDYQGAVDSTGALSQKSHWRCRYCSFRSKCYDLGVPK